MTRYWIAVASREHVLKGVHGGFAQVCHGKKGPFRRGCFEIRQQDFELIAKEMGASHE